MKEMLLFLSYQADAFYCLIFDFKIYSTQCYTSPSLFDLHEHSASPQILLSPSLSIWTSAEVWCSSPTQSRITSGKFMLITRAESSKYRCEYGDLTELNSVKVSKHFSQPGLTGLSLYISGCLANQC